MITGPALELKQLSLTLGDNLLLAPMDLYLPAGELHLLMGANGAGKSSLLKCLAGLQPHAGEVLRHWPLNPTQGTEDHANRAVAYIPQLESFDATLPMTLRDYLAAAISPRAFFRKPTRQAKAQLDQLLEQVGLADKQTRKLGQLSGGERQRLLFARALATGARLWLLDEPMTGLDAEAQARIEGLILQLKASGCTLVMVHHGDDVAERLADQVIEIDAGLRQVRRLARPKPLCPQVCLHTEPEEVAL